MKAVINWACLCWLAESEKKCSFLLLLLPIPDPPSELLLGRGCQMLFHFTNQENGNPAAPHSLMGFSAQPASRCKSQNQYWLGHSCLDLFFSWHQRGQMWSQQLIGREIIWKFSSLLRNEAMHSTTKKGVTTQKDDGLDVYAMSQKAWTIKRQTTNHQWWGYCCSSSLRHQRWGLNS